MKNKAMTLAETLVVMFLLGVVASVTIPALWHARPNDSRMMFRKAYYDAERVISDMINDESLYPELYDTQGRKIPSDFGTISVMKDFPVKDSNGNPVKNADGSIKTENREAVQILGKVHSGPTKFCTLFADKINISGNPDCNANSPGSPNYATPSFISTNGIFWYVPRTNNVPLPTYLTGSGAVTQPIIIGVDINGTKPPNCRCDVDIVQNSPIAQECPASCLNPDRFEIVVESNGKISVRGLKEVQYLNTSDLK